MSIYTEAQLKYNPDTVKTLFIGESPPIKGDYFYFGGNNSLLRYIRQAFVSVYGDKCDEKDEFLQFFKGKGCYLIDLSKEPINEKPKKERRQLRKDNIDLLAKRVKDINPESVIIFMKAIGKDVKKAIEVSGVKIEGRIHTTKFPGFGNQKASIQEIAEALREIENPKQHEG